jgi:hypothetical protein
MRGRAIRDDGEPVVIRTYAWDGMAIVDHDVLEASGIPSIVRRNTTGEITRGAELLVRREHKAHALELLDAPVPPSEPDTD